MTTASRPYNPQFFYASELFVQAEHPVVGGLNQGTAEVLASSEEQYFQEAQAPWIARLMMGALGGGFTSIGMTAISKLIFSEQEIDPVEAFSFTIILFSMGGAMLYNAYKPVSILSVDQQKRAYLTLLNKRSGRIEEVLDELRREEKIAISTSFRADLERLERLQDRIQEALKRIRRFSY